MGREIFFKIVILFWIALFIEGCLWATSPSLPQSSSQKSNLTPGMVKKYVKVGSATQSDIIAVFGAPNIITRDREGNEVWTYDKQSMATAAEVASWNAAGNATIGGGGIVGNSPVGGLASGGGSSGKSSSSGQVSSATFTLMITFDTKDRVKDYRMMATQF